MAYQLFYALFDYTGEELIEGGTVPFNNEQDLHDCYELLLKQYKTESKFNGYGLTLGSKSLGYLNLSKDLDGNVVDRTTKKGEMLCQN